MNPISYNNIGYCPRINSKAKIKPTETNYNQSTPITTAPSFQGLVNGKNPMLELSLNDKMTIVHMMQDINSAFMRAGNHDAGITAAKKIKANPKLAIKLSEMKNADGSKIFTSSQIGNLFLNVKAEDLANEEKLREGIEAAQKLDPENIVGMIWHHMYH